MAKPRLGATATASSINIEQERLVGAAAEISALTHHSFFFALDRSCGFALANAGRFLVVLSPARLAKHAGFFARTPKPAQNYVERLIRPDTNTWHIWSCLLEFRF